MAQFDVHREHEGTMLLLDCQSDLLNHLETRFVVPLLPAEASPKVSRLNPVFSFGQQTLLMATNLASSVARRDLGPPMGSLDHEYDKIRNALDTLWSGV